jgi:hypothetical protein
MRKVGTKMVPKELTVELSLREFLASKQITVLEHPPYSPALAPSDFFLFPKIKVILQDGILMTLMASGVIDGSSEGHSTKPVPKWF